MTFRQRHKEWRCLYCGHLLEEKVQCPMPDCVEARARARHRMGVRDRAVRVRLRGWAYNPVFERQDADGWHPIMSFPNERAARTYAEEHEVPVVTEC